MAGARRRPLLCPGPARIFILSDLMKQMQVQLPHQKHGIQPVLQGRLLNGLALRRRAACAGEPRLGQKGARLLIFL